MNIKKIFRNYFDRRLKTLDVFRRAYKGEQIAPKDLEKALTFYENHYCWSDAGCLCERTGLIERAIQNYKLANRLDKIDELTKKLKENEKS